jgi:hypothetical protein
MSSVFAGSGCVGSDDPAGTKNATVTTDDTTTVQDPLKGSPDQEYDDTGQNACNGMHCCGNGYAMRGLHVPANILRCFRIRTDQEPVCQVDTSNNFRDGTRACPQGKYMKGIDVANNKLTCCPYPADNPATTYTIDGNASQVWMTEMNAFDPPEAPRYEYFNGLHWMHDCPVKTVNGVFSFGAIEGVNVSADDFLCGY